MLNIDFETDSWFCNIVENARHLQLPVLTVLFEFFLPLTFCLVKYVLLCVKFILQNVNIICHVETIVITKLL